MIHSNLTDGEIKEGLRKAGLLQKADKFLKEAIIPGKWEGTKYEFAYHNLGLGSEEERKLAQYLTWI